MFEGQRWAVVEPGENGHTVGIFAHLLLEGGQRIAWTRSCFGIAEACASCDGLRIEEWGKRKVRRRCDGGGRRRCVSGLRDRPCGDIGELARDSVESGSHLCYDGSLGPLFVS